MSYQRILSIQDISCVGQCSLTVALPILSACGTECAILPGAVLSTHTGGFTGYTFRDLTDDFDPIIAHWQKENIGFDALYTGYLGSARQVDGALTVAQKLLNPGAPVIVDPAMADNGKLYYGFDQAFVNEMKRLVAASDVVLPNLTEASFLTGIEYRESGYDEAYILDQCRALCAIGAKTVVLTGTSFEAGKLGVTVYESKTGKASYYFHERLPGGSHGTGDVYASAFVGALMQQKSLFDAARIAADYTLSCIRYTKEDPDHWYGVKFEPLLPELIEKIRE